MTVFDMKIDLINTKVKNKNKIQENKIEHIGIIWWNNCNRNIYIYVYEYESRLLYIYYIFTCYNIFLLLTS